MEFGAATNKKRGRSRKANRVGNKPTFAQACATAKAKATRGRWIKQNKTMKKTNIHFTIIAAFSILSILIIVGCQPTPPPPAPPAPPVAPAPAAITCAFNPPGGIGCTGATIKFNAMAPAGSILKIVGVAAVATGPNSDCATATVTGDSEASSHVISTGVIVNCDCGAGQTVHVVITVVDQNGNVCDAICTLTTP